MKFIKYHYEIDFQKIQSFNYKIQFLSASLVESIGRDAY